MGDTGCTFIAPSSLLAHTHFLEHGSDPKQTRCMVAEQKQVVVYGCSLSVAGIAASLTAEAGLTVVWVDPNAPMARQRLDELHPAVIVFDLSDRALDLYITLRERPELLLIGVDPSSDELLVLSSRPAEALSMADLVDVIAQRERNTNAI